MTLRDNLKAAQSFIFGGDTGTSYEQMKRQRAMAALLASRVANGSPQNVGQGLQAMTGAFVSRRMGDKAEATATEGREKVQSALGSLLQGRLGGASAMGYLPPQAPEPTQAGPVSGAFAGSAAASGQFPASLVQSESGGNWKALNDEGYGGRLQFGAARLADAARAGVIPAGMTGAQFSQLPPEQQQAVEQWHFADIDSQAQRMGLDRYIGQNVGGTPITQDSIRAMAHLGGIGGAAKFLQSGGQYNPSDSNGTSLADYARQHGGGGDVAFTSQMGGGQSGGQGIDPRLMEIMSDPYISELPQMQQGALAALFQQQLAQAYPEQMTPYQQAMLQLEREKMGMKGAKGTEFGLSPQYGVDAEGNPVIIQLGKNGEAVQTKLPEGVTFQKEPIKLDAGTEWVLLDPISRQPIGSVPKNLAQAETEKAVGKAQGEAQASLPGTVEQANRAIANLEAIRDDPALPGITGMIQGRLPPMSQAGTDLNTRIEQAQGQTFLEAFESLKGGGQITEVEGRKAEQAIARLNRAQSTEAYQSALNDLIDVLRAGVQRAHSRAGATMPAGNDTDLLSKYGLQ